MRKCEFYGEDRKKTREFPRGYKQEEDIFPYCKYPNSKWGRGEFGYGPLKCEGNHEKCQDENAKKNSFIP